MQGWIILVISHASHVQAATLRVWYSGAPFNYELYSEICVTPNAREAATCSAVPTCGTSVHNSVRRGWMGKIWRSWQWNSTNNHTCKYTKLISPLHNYYTLQFMQLAHSNLRWPATNPSPINDWRSADSRVHGTTTMPTRGSTAQQLGKLESPWHSQVMDLLGQSCV